MKGIFWLYCLAITISYHSSFSSSSSVLQNNIDWDIDKSKSSNLIRVVRSSFENRSNSDDGIIKYDCIPENPPMQCFEGQAFVTQRGCAEECATVDKTELDNLLNTSSTGSHYNYKVIHLSKTDYVNSSGNIYFKGASISKDVYWSNENDSLSVCYTMPAKFTSCRTKIKIPIEQGDYNYETKSFSMRLHDHSKRNYSWEEFVNLSPYDFLVCIQETRTDDGAYLSGWVISAVSIAVTLIAAYFIPELNLKQNRILLCHLIMFLCTYVFLIIEVVLGQATPFFCELLAYMKYFCILSTFCWISVQAIDIAIRFRTLHCSNSNESKRFLYYKIYAWGGPLFMTFITFVVQNTESEALNPGFHLKCWFSSNKLTVFLYLYGPIALILIKNIILFIFTVVKLYSFRRGSQNTTKYVTQETFYLCCKLMVVMGLVWILEVISWAADGHFKHWFFIEMVVALQGFFIFLVYTLKPSLFRLVKEKCENRFSKKKLCCGPQEKENVVVNEVSMNVVSSTLTVDVESHNH